MHRRVLALLLLATAFAAGGTSTTTEIPDTAWIPAEITPGKTPLRVVITKAGWRSGSEALLLEKSADIQPLYRALAGNARVGFTCGFHWNFLFEFQGAPPESLDINEDCETFRRDPKQTWDIVSTAFMRAKRHPSHFVAFLKPKAGATRNTLREATARFGVLVPAGNGQWFVASRQRWTPARIQRANEAVQKVAEVRAVPELDTGN